MLTQELAAQLAQAADTRRTSDYSLEYNPNQEFRCYSYFVDGVRRVYWDNDFFTWDGNQDGVVNVADVAPIAQYFGISRTDVPVAARADYDGNGKVGIEDITPLAVHFGEICSGFRVEISTHSRITGYSEAGMVDYDEFAETEDHGFGLYSYAVDASVEGPAWAKVWVLYGTGEEVEYDTVAIAYDRPYPVEGEDNSWHPYFPVNDLSVFSTAPATIAWSGSFFVGDGNADRNVSVSDVTSISIHFGLETADSPGATCADYDGNGIVEAVDIECVMNHFGEICSGFAVEISTTGPDSGFSVDGYPGYFDCAGGVNDFGFQTFEYALSSPSAVGPYWVRVTPFYEDWDSIRHLGLPSTAVQFGGE